MIKYDRSGVPTLVSISETNGCRDKHCERGGVCTLCNRRHRSFAGVRDKVSKLQGFVSADTADLVWAAHYGVRTQSHPSRPLGLPIESGPVNRQKQWIVVLYTEAFLIDPKVKVPHSQDQPKEALRRARRLSNCLGSNQPPKQIPDLETACFVQGGSGSARIKQQSTMLGKP